MRISTNNLNGAPENNSTDRNIVPLYTQPHFETPQHYENWKRDQLLRVDQLMKDNVPPQYHNYPPQVKPRPFDLISGYKLLLENLFM